MKTFFKILRYGKSGIRYAYLNIFFNFISILSGVFSLGMIVPFLNIIFGLEKRIEIKPEAITDFDSAYKSFMFFIQNIVDDGGEASALMMICILVVATILLKNVTRYLALYNMVIYRNKAVKEVRSELYKKSLRLPLSYFSDERKGDMLSRMTNDVKELEIAIMTALEALFKEPFTFIVYLTMLLLMSAKLTLFVFLLLPFTVLVIMRIGKSLKKRSDRNQTKLGQLVSMIEETLGGMRIIKAFNAEKHFDEKFTETNNESARLNIAVNHRVDLASPVSETLGVMVLVVILWFGGNMALDTTINPGTFIGFIIFFSQIIPPGRAFSKAFYDVQKGNAAIERIEQILATEERIYEKENATIKEGFGEKIEFKNVSFSYDGEKNVLENINLTINKGETIALVGPSGGGKSTLADMIPRFYDVTEGQVLIDGVDIRDMKITSLRDLMGIVTQESILFNDTIANNIAFGLEGVPQTDIQKAAEVANAHEFITKAEQGYETNIGDRGNKLSGGQRQRVSIARAVLKNPDILILDEATSALDTTSEKLVQEALNNLMQNRTSLVIAHRLSTIQNADKIIVIEKGKIIQQGKHAELIAVDGLYKTLNSLQQL